MLENAVQMSPVSLKQTPILSQRLWLLIVPLLLLTTWLTARHLNGAFWVDEVITVERAGAPIHGGPFSPAQIWDKTASDTYDQVPGYFWLVGAWDNLLGWSEFSTRLLSLMAGLLAVAWTYRLGRDLHSPLAGLGAAVSVATSAYFIYYLHEGRVYAIAVLLGAMLIWLYWRVITRRAGWAIQIALMVCAAAVLYSHYFASLLVFSICLYHVLFVPKNHAWWRVVILLGLAGLLFLPWFLTSFDAVQGANRETWRQELSLNVADILNALLNSFADGGLVVLLMVGALAAQIRRPAERYAWFLLIVPIVLALAVNVWLKMLVSSKFLLYMWVPLGLVFGVALYRLKARSLHAALLLIPWILVGVWSSLNWQENPVEYVQWQVLHDQLAGQVQDDDAIVFHLSAGLWDGQHEVTSQHYFYDFPTLPGMLVSWPHDSDVRYLQRLDTIIGEKPRVWSAYNPAQRPARITAFEEAMIERGFANCGSVAQDPEMAVDLFARPPQEMSYRFGGDLYDDGIFMSLLGSISEGSDDTLLIPLGWQQGQHVPLNTYSFAVHILDSSGTLVGQADSGLPPNNDFGCKVVEIPDIVTGEYQVDLVVYAWETGTRLSILNAGQSDDRVNLGTITIDQ
jgi:hypothetical protein